MPTLYENLSHPQEAAAVTPHDSTLLTDPGILYVGTGGDVVVLTAGGQTVTFSNVPTGSFIPLQVRRVNSTNTTASDILVLY